MNYLCIISLDHIMYVYTTGAVPHSGAWFGRGTGPIHLDNVHCSGNEPNLLACSHLTIDNCGHDDDAGVACPGENISDMLCYDYYSCFN